MQENQGYFSKQNVTTCTSIICNIYFSKLPIELSATDHRALSLSIADQNHNKKNKRPWIKFQKIKIEIFPLPIHPAMYHAAIDESPPSDRWTFTTRRTTPYETQQEQHHWNRINWMLDVFYKIFGYFQRFWRIERHFLHNRKNSYKRANREHAYRISTVTDSVSMILRDNRRPKNRGGVQYIPKSYLG